MIALALTALLPVSAQERKVENRPYTDLRRFHFGVLVGAHLQDIELLNVGPKQYVMEDGSTAERTVTVDQDRWDPGFTVGVLGEARLSQTFQLRIALPCSSAPGISPFITSACPMPTGSPQSSGRS